MKRLYKDIYFTHIIVEIVGIIALIIINYFVYQKYHSTLLLNIIAVGTFAYMIAINLWNTSRAIKRLSILSNKIGGNKGVKEGIKEMEDLLTRAKNKRIIDILKNNLVGAYINLGETKKAMELCGKEQPEYENNVIGKQNRIIYLNNICEISIREGLLSLANKNLSVMKDLIEDKDFNEEQKKQMHQLYSDLIIELVFKEDKIKEYESIEKYYLKRFNEEENIAGKVFFAHQLVKVYQKLKNKKEEKKYQKYYDENKEELNYS